MKKGLIILSFLFSLNVISAQVFTVEKIKNAGDDDKRLNLVVLSEGYQSSEFDVFKTDAENLISDMFTQSPFSEYVNYFNVHIIYVPSNESNRCLICVSVARAKSCITLLIKSKTSQF